MFLTKFSEATELEVKLKNIYMLRVKFAVKLIKNTINIKTLYLNVIATTYNNYPRPIFELRLDSIIIDTSYVQPEPRGRGYTIL